MVALTGGRFLSAAISDQYRLCLQEVYQRYGDNRSAKLKEYLTLLKDGSHYTVETAIERDDSSSLVRSMENMRSVATRAYDAHLDELYRQFRIEERECFTLSPEIPVHPAPPEAAPGNPEEPGTPEEPPALSPPPVTEPVVPGQPLPTNPVDPGEPSPPVSPVEPSPIDPPSGGIPVDPADPENPPAIIPPPVTEPVVPPTPILPPEDQPAPPVQPGEPTPVAPIDPGAPADPTDPPTQSPPTEGDPENPDEPGEPTEPANPTPAVEVDHFFVSPVGPNNEQLPGLFAYGRISNYDANAMSDLHLINQEWIPDGLGAMDVFELPDQHRTVFSPDGSFTVYLGEIPIEELDWSHTKEPGGASPRRPNLDLFFSYEYANEIAGFHNFEELRVFLYYPSFDQPVAITDNYGSQLVEYRADPAVDTWNEPYGAPQFEWANVRQTCPSSEHIFDHQGFKCGDDNDAWQSVTTAKIANYDPSDPYALRGFVFDAPLNADGEFQVSGTTISMTAIAPQQYGEPISFQGVRGLNVDIDLDRVKVGMYENLNVSGNIEQPWRLVRESGTDDVSAQHELYGELLFTISFLNEWGADVGGDIADKQVSVRLGERVINTTTRPALSNYPGGGEPFTLIEDQFIPDPLQPWEFEVSGTLSSLGDLPITVTQSIPHFKEGEYWYPTIEYSGKDLTFQGLRANDYDETRRYWKMLRAPGGGIPSSCTPSALDPCFEIHVCPTALEFSGGRCHDTYNDSYLSIPQLTSSLIAERFVIENIRPGNKIIRLAFGCDDTLQDCGSSQRANTIQLCPSGGWTDGSSSNSRYWRKEYPGWCDTAESEWPHITDVRAAFFHDPDETWTKWMRLTGTLHNHEQEQLNQVIVTPIVSSQRLEGWPSTFAEAEIDEDTGAFVLWMKTSHDTVAGELGCASELRLDSENMNYEWDVIEIVDNRSCTSSPGTPDLGGPFAEPGSTSASQAAESTSWWQRTLNFFGW